jgi:hypothetical protein
MSAASSESPELANWPEPERQPDEKKWKKVYLKALINSTLPVKVEDFHS